jgi:hypothetical protein
MADHALVIGWKDAKVGREARARQLFGEVMGFFGARVADGTLESFEPVILSRHGGDLNGFLLLRGQRAKLDELKESDGFQDIVVQSVLSLEGFGVVDAYIGSSLMEVMERWGRFI